MTGVFWCSLSKCVEIINFTSKSIMYTCSQKNDARSILKMPIPMPAVPQVNKNMITTKFGDVGKSYKSFRLTNNFVIMLDTDKNVTQIK